MGAEVSERTSGPALVARARLQLFCGRNRYGLRTADLGNQAAVRFLGRQRGEGGLTFSEGANHEDRGSRQAVVSSCRGDCDAPGIEPSASWMEFGITRIRGDRGACCIPLHPAVHQLAIRTLPEGFSEERGFVGCATPLQVKTTDFLFRSCAKLRGRATCTEGSIHVPL